MAAAEKKPRTLRVTAQYVQVKSVDGRVFAMHAGDIVTDRVSRESLEHLESLGFIAAE